jgi:hypothetical protein
MEGLNITTGKNCTARLRKHIKLQGMDVKRWIIKVFFENGVELIEPPGLRIYPISPGLRVKVHAASNAMQKDS